ncbi:MAG TPA: DUF354 domain-containing protein [Longimicrobium sp.]|nr:DUF354 domain-containing protein [Longimicrobium sp.]
MQTVDAPAPAPAGPAAAPRPPRRTFVVYMGHPAHFHLFRNPIAELQRRGHDVHVVIKSKDVLEKLLDGAGMAFHNLHPEPRPTGKVAVARSLLLREYRFWKLARRLRPDLMVGTSAEVIHVGKLLGIPSVYLGEDDAQVVDRFARICFPFVDAIVAPESCSLGKWEHKTTHYPGYHKLAYLHPNRFTPERARVAHLLNPAGPTFLVRVVELNAHHDDGIRGFTPQILRGVMSLLASRGRVHLSAEGALPADLEPYRLRMDPLDVHHLMYHCDLVVGDGQSMIVEAAMLGTPSVRFNDFVGRIGVLDELEHRYRLTRGVPADRPGELMEAIRELLELPEARQEWQRRRAAMLADKSDVTAFYTWFLENYPASREVVRQTPGYLERFR